MAAGVKCNQTLLEGMVEYGIIEREIYIEAAPEIVFDVVSKPEHLRAWWPDEAAYDPTPGSNGQIVFGSGSDATTVGFAVLETDPPRSVSFRWTHPVGELAAVGNSLQVTFTLRPSGRGTLLTLTESGFRELGWEVALLEHQYAEHERGWDFYLPRLVPYAARLGTR